MYVLNLIIVITINYNCYKGHTWKVHRQLRFIINCITSLQHKQVILMPSSIVIVHVLLIFFRSSSSAFNLCCTFQTRESVFSLLFTTKQVSFPNNLFHLNNNNAWTWQIFRVNTPIQKILLIAFKSEPRNKFFVIVCESLIMFSK